MSKKLYIVIPCYNEEEVLPITSKMFLDKLNTLISQNLVSDDSRILFINDGSKDKTWEIIEKLSQEDEHYEGICLSRNHGHQNALLSGLMEIKDIADVTISIDCDGQDDINAMDAMIKEYYDGSDIVYGVRSSRETDTFFKRTTAQGFYKFIEMMGVEIVYNHADYRLISGRALREFSKFEEVNLFLRGMVPLVGFKSTSVYYEREERYAGESHYPLSKILALAINGITSLSIKPLRFSTFCGLVVAVISFIGVIWSIIVHMTGYAIDGWASMTAIICFLGGIQLISIGILGEYIGKIYLEVKKRPRYIVSERTWEDKK